MTPKRLRMLCASVLAGGILAVPAAPAAAQEVTHRPTTCRVSSCARPTASSRGR